jgi:hypothetical protein
MQHGYGYLHIPDRESLSEGEKIGERTWKSHVHLSVLQSMYWPVKRPAARIGAHIRI